MEKNNPLIPRTGRHKLSQNHPNKLTIIITKKTVQKGEFRVTSRTMRAEVRIRECVIENNSFARKTKTKLRTKRKQAKAKLHQEIMAIISTQQNK